MTDAALAALTPEDEIIVLEDFAAQDSARMEILLPKLLKSAGWIDFAGPGHPKLRRLNDEATRKRLFEERQRLTNNRYKPPEKTPDDVVEENVKFIVDRIIDWSIYGRTIDADGNEKVGKVPFEHKTAMTMLSEPKWAWLFADCMMFLGSIENFMPASPQS